MGAPSQRSGGTGIGGLGGFGSVTVWAARGRHFQCYGLQIEEASAATAAPAVKS